MAYTPVQRNDSADAINRANLAMRQTPWYQQYFTARGLNQNSVHLSDAQRKELANIAAQNGMPLGSDGMNIDPAGNINTPHGFASQPTWLKTLEIAAPIAATAFFTGGGSLRSLGNIFGMGGSGAATSSGLSALPTTQFTLGAGGGGSTIGSLLGIGGGAGGFHVADIVKSAIAPSINAVAGSFMARSEAKSADRSLAAQTDAAKYSADLQAKAAADQLAFLKESEATRQREFEKTQALNLDQYNQGQARLAPYRAMGTSALSLFGRPINLGSLLGVH